MKWGVAMVRVTWAVATGWFGFILAMQAWMEWVPPRKIPCFPGQGGGPGFHLDIICFAAPPLLPLVAVAAIAAGAAWFLTRSLVRMSLRKSAQAIVWLIAAGAAGAFFGLGLLLLVIDEAELTQGLLVSALALTALCFVARPRREAG